MKTKSTTHLNSLKNNRRILTTGILTFMAMNSVSTHAISIGAGPITLDFATTPTAADWSTIAAGLASSATGEATYGTAAQLDAGVQTIVESAATAALVVSATNPTSVNPSGRYNSTLQLLQTRPLTVNTAATSAAAFMIGRLVNSNAVPITNLGVSFLGGLFDNGGTEQIPGQRVYFSLTGLANSWTNIAALNWSAAGTTSSSFATTGWLAGQNAYILFADDNNTAGAADNGYTVDNLTFTPTLGASGTSLKWNLAHTVGGAPSGTFAVSASQYWLNGAAPSGFASGDNVSFTDAPGTPATITVPANIGAGSVTVNHASGTYEIAGAGAITAAFTKNGAGTLKLSSNNTFSSASLSGGTVITSAATPFGTAPVTVAGPITLQADASLSVGALGGTSVLTKTSVGDLTTTAVNAAATTVNVDGGKLIIGNNAGFSSATSTINVNAGGSLEATAPTTATVVAGNLNLNNPAGSTITINSATETGATASGLSLTKANGITTAGPITKAGLGLLRVTAAQTLTNNWVVTGGFLEAGNVGAFGTGSIAVSGGWVTLASPGASTAFSLPNNITLNGGGLGVKSLGVAAATPPFEEYLGAINVTAPSFLSPKRTSTPANYNGFFISGILSGSGSLTETGPIVAAVVGPPAVPQNTPVNPNLTDASTVHTLGAVTLRNTGNTYSGNFIIESQQILSALPSTGSGDVFGTSSFTLKGGAIRVLDNGTVDNGTLAYNHAITVAVPNDAVNPGVATVFVDRQTNAATPSATNPSIQGTKVGNTVQFSTLGIAAGQSFRTAGANAYGVGFSGLTTVTGTGDVTFDATTAPLTLAGGLTGGAVNLVKTGGSTLKIDGAKTYTGNTTVSAGTLDISSGGLTVGVGQILAGAGNVTGVVTASGGGSVHPGNATGVGTLTMTDLTLGTSSLQYTFNAGTVGLISVGNLVVTGAANSVTVNFLGLNPALGIQTLIDYTGTALTTTQFQVFTQGALFSRIQATLQNNTANTSVDLNVTGVKNPIWTGGTSTEWSTGTLAAPKNWVLSGGGAQTDFIASDKVVFDNTPTASAPVVDISVADVLPADVLVDSTKNYTINGPFAIAGAAPLLKNNTGKLTITNTNSFTGSVTINGGTVSVPTISDSGVAGTLGAGTNALAIDNNAALEFTGTAGSTNRAITLGAGGGAVSTPTGSALTLAGVIGPVTGGPLTKKGTGTVVLTGLTNVPSAITIEAGTLQVGDGTVVGSIGAATPVTNNGTLAFNTPAAGLTVANTITGTGGLTKTGAGNVTLSNAAVANTFTGDTVVNGGSLILSHTSGTNSVGGNVIVNTGGTVAYGTTAGQIANHIPDTATVTVAGGTFGSGAGATQAAPTQDVTETVASVIVNSGTFLSGRTPIASPFTVTGAFAANGGTTIVQRGGSLAANSITIATGATFGLDGGSTTAGQQSRLLVGAGGLQLTDATISLNSGPSAVVVTTSKGSEIILAGNVTSTGTNNITRVSNVATALAQIDVNGAQRTFTVGGTLNVGTFASPVSVINSNTTTPGGIIKAGTGTLLLSGTNTYNGDTVIQDGTLTLTGTLSGSANIDVQTSKTFDVSGAAGGFSLGATQTLKGNGNVVGTTTVGGTLAPGASIGTLHFANDLIFVAGGIGLFEVNKAAGNIRTNDKALVTGALTLAGNLNISASGLALAQGDTFDLFDALSFSGTMVNVSASPGPGLAWDLTNLGVDGTVTVIPEPGSVALLVLGSTLLFRRRRQA